MEKYIEMFCNQNPEFEIECHNPECKRGGKHKFKSIDVLKNSTFEFICENSTITFDSKYFLNSLKNELLKYGMRW